MARSRAAVAGRVDRAGRQLLFESAALLGCGAAGMTGPAAGRSAGHPGMLNGPENTSLPLSGQLRSARRATLGNGRELIGPGAASGTAAQTGAKYSPPPTTRGRVAQQGARISHELSQDRHELRQLCAAAPGRLSGRSERNQEGNPQAPQPGQPVRGRFPEQLLPCRSWPRRSLAPTTTDTVALFPGSNNATAYPLRVTPWQPARGGIAEPDRVASRHVTPRPPAQLPPRRAVLPPRSIAFIPCTKSPRRPTFPTVERIVNQRLPEYRHRTARRPALHASQT